MAADPSVISVSVSAVSSGSEDAVSPLSSAKNAASSPSGSISAATVSSAGVSARLAAISTAMSFFPALFLLI